MDGGAAIWSSEWPLFPVAVMAFSPERRRLVITGRGGGAVIWDMPTNRRITLRNERIVAAGDSTSPTSRTLFDTAARRLVLTGAPDRDHAAVALTVFDTATGDALRTIRGATAPLAFSHDDLRLITLDPEAGGLEARVLQSAVTGADGSFQLAVPAGQGHLLVIGGTHDFVHVETSVGELEYGRPSMIRNYPDAVIPLDLKPGVVPQDGQATLCRGVTVRAKVLAPNGEPAAKFTALSRS
jgi:hypothetical protein